jgi:uncharacterized protein
MKFQPENLEGQLIVQSYDEKSVVINGVAHHQSVAFGTDLPPTPWPNPEQNGLTLAMCEWLYEHCPSDMEVLLIGTGQKQVFPAIAIRRFFIEKKCPVEYMDTQAACRTYNILVGEGRHAIAALIL